MILTVTLNSGVDKVLLVDEFLPGLPVEARKVVTSVGGKGLDVSVTLRALGVETTGLAFVAGETGRVLEGLIKAYGILPALVWVGGETRTCYVIAESKQARVSHIKYGELQISSAQVDQFLKAFQMHLSKTKWVICSGSIPPALPESFYRGMVNSAVQAGVKVLVDSSQKALLSTLPSHPTILKMNMDEFNWTFHEKASTVEELIPKARQTAAQHSIANLVVTCGSQGMLAITQEGCFHTRAPKQPVVNAAGAGDGASAALVWRLSLGEPWKEALKWAAAVSAAVVLTAGTADCQMKDVKAIYPDTVVEAISYSR
jgi:1-phosphofructokinase family hexose kinase